MTGDPRVFTLLEEMLDTGRTPEEVCREFPDMLAEVQERWREFRLVDAAIVELIPDLQTEADVRTSPVLACDHAEIPDFELFDEIGRGGMGVVYRARDVSLGRDVAVKLLQDKYAVDAPIAQRFTDEARITAQLQHPGIPAVYRVGALADGRPFLAMKLIKGSTLAVLLDDRPDTFTDRGRCIAIFEQVCQAVAYAHSLRVIHRDLKPSNIMVGKFGEVQVMDWGIAKVLPQECSTTDRQSHGQPLSNDGAVIHTRPLLTTDISSGAGLPRKPTRAGSVLGTPAYMAPEQAGGEVDRLDTRSDVFGLGAILCEVLTGQPPYTNRAESDIFRKALHADLTDARARLADCQAEPELVELCLKCLAPEPQDRPRNAGEVAAAVQALRMAAETRARQAELDRVRTAEESKRRRMLLAASAAVVAVLLAGLSVSLWQTWRVAQERDEKDKALAAEQTARQLTMAALRDLTDDVVDDRIASGTQLTEENKEYMRKIIKHFESFAAITANDAVSRSIRAEGHARVGFMLHGLGELHDAEAAYRTAVDLQKQLAYEFPTRPAYREQLARTLNDQGILLSGTGRHKEAETVYSTALDLRKQLAVEFPANPEFRRDLARSQNEMGVLFRDTGRPKEAEKAHDTALDIQKKLAADFPDRSDFIRELARIHNDQGILLYRTGGLKEAEAAYSAAVQLQTQLANDFPNRVEFRQELGKSQNNLAVLFRGAGRLKYAETAFIAILAIQKKLAADFPTRPEFRQQLATSHNNLGTILNDVGQLKQAEAEYVLGLNLRKQLAADFPNRPEFCRELGRSHSSMGVLFRSMGRLKEAETAFTAALDLQKQLAADFPDRVEYRQDLARCHNNLGVLFRGTGRLKEAELEYKAALDIRKQLAADSPGQPDVHNELAGTYVNFAVFCNQRREFQAAKEYLEEARSHHQVALKTNSRNPSYRQFYRNNLWALTRANAGLLDQKSALQIADTIRDLGWNPPDNTYDAALAMALCIPIAANHDQLDAAQREEAMKFYSDAAMNFLHEAVGKGFKDAAQIKKNTDLDPLHEREDFKKLLAELEKRATDTKPAEENKP